IVLVLDSSWVSPATAGGGAAGGAPRARAHRRENDILASFAFRVVVQFTRDANQRPKAEVPRRRRLEVGRGPLGRAVNRRRAQRRQSPAGVGADPFVRVPQRRDQKWRGGRGPRHLQS